MLQTGNFTAGRSYAPPKPEQHPHVMAHRPVVKLQLLLLAALVILIMWRLSAGPRIDSGFVQMQPSSLGSLEETAFTVSSPMDIQVRASGAFETDESGAPLAAYGWIWNVDNNEVAWSMENFRVTRDGVLATSEDSLRLNSGSYKAYFTTLGPTPSSREQRAFLGLRPHWTNYKESFFLVLSSKDDNSVRVGPVATTDASNVIWSARHVGNRKTMEEWIHVDAGARIHVHAVAGLCSAGCDQAYFENTVTGERVWEMTMANTADAGGWESNRVFDDIIQLGKGLYRVVFRTDRSHAWNVWSANPPVNPDAFGIVLRREEGDVNVLAQWSDSTPYVSILDVGSDETRHVRFRVAESVLVLIEATGEISDNGTLYDFGYLVRESNGERVWRMSREKSAPAGGHETNRTERAVVRLEPGDYSVHFETDDSHAFGDWRKQRPSHTDRWGIALFPVDDVPGAVTVESGAIGETEYGDLLVALREAGNNTAFRQRFALLSESDILIQAMGEISTNGQYDHGWIERAGTGDKVWEMTMENTEHAGGDDRNRMFSGVITLPEGEYEVHYVSDYDYAFGDFGDGAPGSPADWGIRIFGR